MNPIIRRGMALVLLLAMASAQAQGLDALDQWGQWRGPLGSGVAPHGDPPVEWDESKNIRWKVPIPGLGHSTPIIWGDQIFLTAAISHGKTLAHSDEHPPGAHNNLSPLRLQEFVLIALNRADGSVRWQRTLRDERPHESTHETGSWASNSPVTDGEHVFAHFGSRGLYCVDMKGNLVWEKDLGDMRTLHGHGEGSSPTLYGDTLIVNWDHEGQSFVAALDKRTGKARWQVTRDEVTSWATPLVVVHEGKPQVIVAATNRTRSYDLKTGRVLWECAGLSRNVVASPVASDGMVFVTSSYDFQAMLAIRLDRAKGDITGSDAIAWTRDRHTPYVPSPLLYDDHLYFLRHYQGFLTCVEASTGRSLFGPQRLKGIANVFASLAGAAGRVYIVSRNGTTMVIAHGSKFELLARNHLDDSFSASPAIVGRELYLRGERHLYCIVEEKK